MKERSKRDLYAGIYLKLSEKEVIEADKIRQRLGVGHKEIYLAGLDSVKEAYKSVIDGE